MNTEIEAKFLNQNHADIRKKLKLLGATLVLPERTMKRVNYDFPDDRLDKIKGWVRVRDEGNIITLSYKQSDDTSLHGMQEINLKVNSFADAQKFLTAIGVTKLKAYQETKRESWSLNGVDIELDTWPWIKPFIELEAPTEELLRKVADLLDLDMTKAEYGSVIPAYQAEYNITPAEMSNWPEYKFGMPVPSFFIKHKEH